MFVRIICLFNRGFFIYCSANIYLNSMSEVIIYEEPYVIVTYIPRFKLVKIVWDGNISLEMYQKAFNLALNFQAKELVPVYNFLSDIRKQGLVNPENRKWFEQYVLPRAVNQGLRRGAVISDANVFKKYYLNLILQSTNRFKLPFRFFDEVDEALAWFDSFGE